MRADADPGGGRHPETQTHCAELQRCSDALTTTARVPLIPSLCESGGAALWKICGMDDWRQKTYGRLTSTAPRVAVGDSMRVSCMPAVSIGSMAPRELCLLNSLTLVVA